MLIISAIQFKPTLAKCQADVRNNFRRCLPLIDTAVDLGSNLIVLPELFLTGYGFHSKEQAYFASEPSNGPTFREMRSIAADCDAYVAFGYLETEGGIFYNSGMMIDPKGDVVCKYRKVNLWGNDFLWATPGDITPQVVTTDFGNLSMVICRDIRSKIPHNIPRKASATPFFKNTKPDIVALCANWGKGGFPSTTWMDYSTNRNCVLVVSNRYGIEHNDGQELDFGTGGSAIIEPDWSIHTNGLEFGKDCTVTAALEEK
jgi:predicted amidohydrolase